MRPIKRLFAILLAALLPYVPALSATLIGADQTAATCNPAPGGTPAFIWQNFVASATGSVSSMNIDWGSNNNGGSAIIAIYDNSSSPNGALLGETASFTPAASGVQTVALQSAVSVTSGTTYNIAVYTTVAFPQFNCAASGTQYLIWQTGLTFPTLPNPTADTSGTGNNQPAWAIWGTSSGSAVRSSQFFMSGKNLRASPNLALRQRSARLALRQGQKNRSTHKAAA
jgi:hypothetical protein